MQQSSRKRIRGMRARYQETKANKAAQAKAVKPHFSAGEKGILGQVFIITILFGHPGDNPE
jgi:hypothetical protein